MFAVDATKYDPNNGTIMFSKGGFQGARGDDEGEQFYIENVMEELDSGTEWFYNKTTKILYYFRNGTEQMENLVFEATNLKVVMNYTGTMDKPVENQTIRGMTIRDTQYTYLDPHGMPRCAFFHFRCCDMVTSIAK